jgi:hypothetical protein
MAMSPFGGGVKSRYPGFIAFLDRLHEAGREGEWSTPWTDPHAGRTGWLTVEDGGRRIGLEVEGGPWMLAWLSPTGEWRIESLAFPFESDGCLAALLAEVGI